MLQGPDGKDYKNEVHFVEILEPERIVMDHVSAPKFRVIATFASDAGETTVTFRQRFDSAGECDRVRKYAVEANEQNLDRLEEELAKMV